jgi:hypothetical protein
VKGSRSKAKRAKRDAAKQRSVHGGQGHGERVVTHVRRTNFMPTYEERLASRFSRERTEQRLLASLGRRILGRKPLPEVEGVDVIIEGEDDNG